MLFWSWLPVALIAMDLAVLALVFRRRRESDGIGLLHVFANLATLSGLLAWMRWGCGVECPGWALLWLGVFFAWSLATPLVADWHARRPLGRFRVFLALGDAICLAAMSGYLYHDRPVTLAVIWTAMAAGYGLVATVFRRHVPADARGAAIYMALAALMLALVPAAVLRGPDGPLGRPHGVVALWWTLIGPLFVGLGVALRYPMMRFVGLGLVGLLTLRALYDCRPPEDAAIHPLAKVVAAEAGGQASKTPAAASPDAGSPASASSFGEGRAVATRGSEGPEVDGTDQDNSEVKDEPIEWLLVWVRPGWLLAMAPFSMALCAALLWLAARRSRGRTNPSAAVRDSPSAFSSETANAAGDMAGSGSGSASSFASASASASTSDEAPCGMVCAAACGDSKELDEWLAAGATLATGVMTLFFLHLECTVWTAAYGTSIGEALDVAASRRIQLLYYTGGVGTTVLWSLGAIPFFTARRPGARWAGLALLAVGWMAVLALAARGWGIADMVPAWRNARPVAYAVSWLATGVWAATFDKPVNRRAGFAVTALLALCCLLGECLAMFGP